MSAHLLVPTPSLNSYITTPAHSNCLVSVVIVSWNTKDMLLSCVQSLYQHCSQLNLEVWIVDNASSDQTPESVRSNFPQVNLICNTSNLGFSAANNQALSKARGDYILLLNPDTEFRMDALTPALSELKRGDRTLAIRLVNRDGSTQASCFRFPSLPLEFAEAFYLDKILPKRMRARICLGDSWRHDTSRSVDWALGAFLFLPRAALLQAGPLPPEYAIFGEDIEWCWRLRNAGYPVYYFPKSEIVHFGNQSGSQLPPTWRVECVYSARRVFLHSHYGTIRGLAHRYLDFIRYGIRALTCFARSAERYRARYYMSIIQVLLRSGHHHLNTKVTPSQVQLRCA